MADFNSTGKPMDFEHGFTIDFNIANGLSCDKATSKRLLSKVKGMFADEKAADEK